jgi:diguanylate cyclase (GGDEF)-like protein
MNRIEIQLRHMERILAISHDLVSNHSLNEILHQIVQVAAELVDCETVGILLLDEQPNTLRFIAATLYHDHLFDIPVPIDSSIAGAAFASDQPVIVPDAQLDPRYYPKVAELLNYPAHSLLAVPLKFHERKIGILEAENKKNDQCFDDADAQVLTALVTQATIAIENARLVEGYKLLAQAEQNQRQMAEALRQASAALSCTLDFDQVIDRILEHISQVIPGDASNVMVIESGNIARVFRGRGYQKFGTAEMLTSIALNPNSVTGLRRMYETHQPIVIPDVAQDPTWVYSRPEHHWIRSYVGVPIIARDMVVGFLNAMSATPNLYNETHAERLHAFAHHAATAIENARLYRLAQEEIAERTKVEEELRRHRNHLEELVKERTAELTTTLVQTELLNHQLQAESLARQRAQEELRLMAITDELTGVNNRRQLSALGQQAFRHACRYHRTLTALMVDADYFKNINDTFGHAVGDEVLKLLANYLQQNLREADILSRYGGDEFVVLMPETDLEIAQEVASRLLAGICDLALETVKGQVKFTVSLGVAILMPGVDRSVDDLVDHADQAMYAAKQAGRSQVAIFQR